MIYVKLQQMYYSDCSVLCVERDDADGHYDCDHDGNKMCLEGYRNTSTDCTECVTATGCCKKSLIAIFHDTQYCNIYA